MQKNKSIFKFIIDEFIYGGHIQSLGSLGIVLVSSILFKINAGWNCFVVIYLIMHQIYLYNRHKEISIDYYTNSERTQHLKKYSQYNPLIITSSFIVSMAILFFYSNMPGILFTFSLFILGILYTDFFKKLTRKIPFFKNIYVSLFFVALIFFPFFYYNVQSYIQQIITLIIGLSVIVFIRAILMQISLDIKDIKSDQKESLKTIPVIIGKENTIKMLFYLSIFESVFILPLLIYHHALPLTTLLLIFLPFVDLIKLHLIQNNNIKGYIIAGSEFIWWPPLIFIAQTIFFNYNFL